MSAKQEILEQLRAARSAHIKWRSYAHALAAGVTLDEGKVPIIHTDCKFGQWYYGEGQKLSTLDSFREIEQPHELLHHIYLKLFQKLFQEDDIGLFGRLLGKASRHATAKAHEVQTLLDQLNDISRILIERLENLESELLRLEHAAVRELI